MTPLAPTSASELLTRSTSVPVVASSVMVVWKVDEVKTGTLSFTSLTRTVTVPVPLRDGEPEVKKKERGNLNFPKTEVTLWVKCFLPLQEGDDGTVTSDIPLTLTLTSCRPFALDKLSAARSTRKLIDALGTPFFFFFCSSGCRLEFPSAAESAHAAAAPEHIKRAQRLWNQTFQPSFLRVRGRPWVCISTARGSILRWAVAERVTLCNASEPEVLFSAKSMRVSFLLLPPRAGDDTGVRWLPRGAGFKSIADENEPRCRQTRRREENHDSCLL